MVPFWRIEAPDPNSAGLTAESEGVAIKDFADSCFQGVSFFGPGKWIGQEQQSDRDCREQVGSRAILATTSEDAGVFVHATIMAWLSMSWQEGSSIYSAMTCVWLSAEGSKGRVRRPHLSDARGGKRSFISRALLAQPNGSSDIEAAPLHAAAECLSTVLQSLVWPPVSTICHAWRPGNFLASLHDAEAGGAMSIARTSSAVLSERRSVRSVRISA